MPRPRKIAYAFTPKEAASITELSVHMLNYLSRMGYLQPAYPEGALRTRGKVRYYSYRDLVVARTIRRLCDAGVEFARLKLAIQTLALEETWIPKEARQGDDRLRWLVTDGKEVFLENNDGFLDQLRPNGQRAFGFVVSLANMQKEVRGRLPRGRRSGFSMRNRPLPDFEPLARTRRG